MQISATLNLKHVHCDKVRVLFVLIERITVLHVALSMFFFFSQSSQRSINTITTFSVRDTEKVQCQLMTSFFPLFFHLHVIPVKICAVELMGI